MTLSAFVVLKESMCLYITLNYCSSTVRNGELRLYTCCQSSSWLIHYKPLILEWVRKFCAQANLNGQVSFDFIESTENGQPYAIECNPRTHTAITTFYNHPLVAEAYLDMKHIPNGPIQPYLNAREIYWLHHELWNLFKVKCIEDLRCILQRLIHGKEAINSIEDPLPFFLHYTVHMPYVLIKNFLNPIHYTKIDSNLALLL